MNKQQARFLRRSAYLWLVLASIPFFVRLANVLRGSYISNPVGETLQALFLSITLGFVAAVPLYYFGLSDTDDE
jgi:hypothetical protein